LKLRIETSDVQTVDNRPLVDADPQNFVDPWTNSRSTTVDVN